MVPSAGSSSPTDHDALLDAIQSVLTPLADLAVAKGLTFAVVEESLKQAFVRAAQEAQVAQGLPAHPLVSRISAATGISRREVTRLTQSDAGAPQPAAASVVSQLFTRWISDKQLRVRGKPRALPRQGGRGHELRGPGPLGDAGRAPPHPARRVVPPTPGPLDADTDTVHLLQEAFAPRGDWQRMVAFLGDNVPLDEPAHFEQAVFAQGLSEDSIERVRALARKHWKALTAEAVPLLEQRVQSDAEQAAVATRRVPAALATRCHVVCPKENEMLKALRLRMALILGGIVLLMASCGGSGRGDTQANGSGVGSGSTGSYTNGPVSGLVHHRQQGAL